MIKSLSGIFLRLLFERYGVNLDRFIEPYEDIVEYFLELAVDSRFFYYYLWTITTIYGELFLLE